MTTLPQPGEVGFRCAAASGLRDDGLAGSGSTARAYLLLEDPGPWGSDAFRDARLPDGLGPEVKRHCAEAGVRPLLVRRPGGRSASGAPRRVFAAHAGPSSSWLETGLVDDPHDVLDLDLAGLRSGRSVGLDRTEETVFAVCTHGKHDACCAERGRPAAAALCQAHPESTWEVSHIGGDRFAGNMVVLPHGLYYGRVDARSALEIAGAHLAGDLVLDHLRGRSSLPMPVQAAEVALRRELAVTRHDAVRFVSRSNEDDLTRSRFDVAGTVYEVQVTTLRGAPARLTCSAVRDNPVPAHRVDDIRVVT